jgi:hypothetical protein
MYFEFVMQKTAIRFHIPLSFSVIKTSKLDTDHPFSRVAVTACLLVVYMPQDTCLCSKPDFLNTNRGLPKSNIALASDIPDERCIEGRWSRP